MNQQKKMSNNYFETKEHSEITKDIGSKYFKELEEFAQNNPNLLTYAKKGVLKTTQYVGIIQTKSGFVLEILPKIGGKEILIKMLKTLKDSNFKLSNETNLKSQKNFPLLEIFIEMYLDEVEKVIKKGIKSNYILKTENQNFLKGKLKINEHIKKNYIHKERFFVEYDEYLPDIVENQIIKTTLKKLSKLSHNFKNQKRIREFLFVFDGIREIYNPKNSFSRIIKNRMMNYYEKVLGFSKVFLLQETLIPYKGKNEVFALLFDMNVLFENYVESLLKNSKIKNLQTKFSREYLLSENTIGLEPDYMFKLNNELIIADAKYKILEKKLKREDVFQVYSYMNYFGCDKAYIFAPKSSNEKNKTYTIEKTNKTITLFYVDIKKDKIINFEKRREDE